MLPDIQNLLFCVLRSCPITQDHLYNMDCQQHTGKAAYLACKLNVNQVQVSAIWNWFRQPQTYGCKSSKQPDGPDRGPQTWPVSY